MATKKSFITDDLDFAEAQLKEWKEFILANPVSQATDRRGEKEMPNGQIAKNAIIATKENVIKCVEEMMERYLRMLPIIDELREKETAKMEARGHSKVNPMMEREMNK